MEGGKGEIHSVQKEYKITKSLTREGKGTRCKFCRPREKGKTFGTNNKWFGESLWT